MTFFGLNRAYLLLTIIFCLLSPFSTYLNPVSQQPITHEQQNIISPITTNVLQSVSTLQSEIHTFQNAEETPISWIYIIYFLVAGILLLRLFWSFIAVNRLSNGATTHYYNGVKIICSDRITQPLSMFRSIYMPKQGGVKLPNEILLHEKVHVEQWHFIDLLIVELVAVVFWFNPFIYLYKRSIRLNLEYLADRNVLKQGTNLWQYQSTLLSQAINKNYSLTLATNFSTPLKDRIEMMKKNRSKLWMKMAIMGAIPLAIILTALNTKSALSKPIIKTFKPVLELADSTDKPSMSPLGDGPFKVTSGFGMKMHPILKVEKMHTGVDLTAKSGTPIFATADGWVTLTKYDEAKGNFVQIKHSEVYTTQYSHMASFKVLQGEMVKKGQVIGYVGSTGQSTGPHLHYEIHENGEAIDPESILGGC
ncbi:MAG TPA: M23/M56 family metallopeptidase [Fulvivirga sp.]|nr:M23/M56 family metallopeptidase [Fulvivirga sp.]